MSDAFWKPIGECKLCDKTRYVRRFNSTGGPDPAKPNNACHCRKDAGDLKKRRTA